MNLFDRLLGRHDDTDPTLKWGSFTLPIPDVDMTKMAFGTLRFGDEFTAAAFLGRPDRCKWTQPEYCELLYASGGFQVDYDRGRFAYIAFFIGPDKFLSKHRALEFSKPRLHGCVPAGIRLSRDTNRALLEQLFGAANSVDTEPRETILCYTRQGIVMEFEMDGKTGRLKRWNLYPSDTTG
jgi:hypothetical protein